MASVALSRISALLQSDDDDTRRAAARVLGEVGGRDRAVVRSLAGALGTSGPLVDREILMALSKLDATPVIEAVLAHTASTDDGVRQAAVDALVATGSSVVKRVKALFGEASSDQRRALEAVLARLGGSRAFEVLLASLDEADDREAGAAAVTMREQARTANGKQRAGYRAQLERCLELQRKRKPPNEAAVKAALKMLGYLEDATAAATLLRYLKSTKQPAAVRREALIALRFCIQGKKASAAVVRALVTAASDVDGTLAKAALLTLASVGLSDSNVEALVPLLEHEDETRALFVVDMLAQRPSRHSTAALVGVATGGAIARAERAAAVLAGRAEAAALLASALSTVDDADRARLLCKPLAPLVGELTTKQRGRLVTAALDGVVEQPPGWQAKLQVARTADGPGVADGLRKLVGTLVKRRRPAEATAVLRLLCRSGEATGEDRFRLASRLLAASTKDASARARRSDESLALLGALLREGFDIGAALQRDRAVDLSALYYVGFHFAEQHLPIGGKLLERVVARGGRKKVARMAKNKLALLQR